MDDISIFADLADFYNKKIESVPKPKINLDVDVEGTLSNSIITAEENNVLNTSDLNSFSQQSQNRNQIYNIIDQMCEDAILSAALETYAEDATEYNDSGNIVWCESSDADVVSYITYLLNTMNVDKNIYRWVSSLCKYGDIYLRLYRQSEYKDPIFEKDNIKEHGFKYTPEPLNENLLIREYSKNDKLAHYIEMVANPAEMFELTKFGKTYGYIKARVDDISYNGYNTTDTFAMYNQSNFTYKFKEKDIEIYDAKTFVHASLDDNLNRFPEEVSIFVDNLENEDIEAASYTYSVKKGQSIFYNVYKTWRYIKLLEDAILLNRVSKSSITRIINVEVGEMPKENVQSVLQRIKSMIEQKAALSVNQSINEYTNPGPIDNCIYIPTYNGKGAISEQTLSSGDADIKSIVDLDYFKDNLYGALKIPKQFLGDTDDATGFNGGTSLSLTSSRYAKTIKRIQNTILQALTDAINLMLLDKGLTKYINKFTLKMVAPMTQEELDKRSAKSEMISLIGDIMSLFDQIEDPIVRLKILKSLITDVVTDVEVINLLQGEIDKLEKEAEKEATNTTNVNNEFDEKSFDDDFDDDFNSDYEGSSSSSNMDFSSSSKPSDDISYDLPSPNDLGLDMTDSNNEEF